MDKFKRMPVEIILLRRDITDEEANSIWPIIDPAGSVYFSTSRVGRNYYFSLYNPEYLSPERRTLLNLILSACIRIGDEL
jgi:hypothetical protein